MGKAKKKSAKTSVFGDRNTRSGMLNIRPTYKGSPPKKKAPKKK